MVFGSKSGQAVAAATTAKATKAAARATENAANNRAADYANRTGNSGRPGDPRRQSR
jgi:hypothetical protein